MLEAKNLALGLRKCIRSEKCSPPQEFIDAPAADIVEAFNILNVPQVSAIVMRAPDNRAVEFFDQPTMHHRSAVLRYLPLEKSSFLLEHVSADQRSLIIKEMSALERRRFLPLLSNSTQLEATQLLKYPERTAGSIMTSEFVHLHPKMLVKEALSHIKSVAREKETIYACYVLDEERQTLLGAVSLRDLVVADGSKPVSSVMRRKPAFVNAMDNQEDVAKKIAKYNLLALPVVEDSGRVIGFVTVDDVIDVMVREQTEDVMKMAAISTEAIDLPYMKTPLMRLVRRRAGWLIILFLGEMLTATAMSYFEGEIAKAVVLALFVPLIISSGGNSGSQATTLIIRALALNEVKICDWWRVFGRETISGLTLGLILGVIGFCRIALWAQFTNIYGPHWLLIATTVSISLVGIVLWGALAGSMLPFVLRRAGLDPATASAPFVATLVDVTGLVIYFSVALVIMHGTLL